jgi:hypothetical protein
MMKASRPQHVREAKTRAELGAVHFLFEGCRNFVRKDAFGHYRWQKTHFFVKRDHGPERGALSRHAGDDHRKGGAKSRARGEVRFSKDRRKDPDRVRSSCPI